MHATRPATHRHPAGLVDVRLTPHPDGGLVTPDAPGEPLTGRRLAELVRRGGEPSDDARMLIDDGAAFAPLFREVAGLLGRDVLCVPEGAVLGGDPAVIARDRVTGVPVEWTVIQPPDLATPLPGWFAVDGGVVRPRTGLVALPLPGGFALATRADFVTRRAAAHRLRPGHPGLATVAVTVRDGDFVAGDYDGTCAAYPGRGLAAVLGDLPLYGGDLRLWLTWPTPEPERARLRANLAALADATGATVWAPPPGGGAELLADRSGLCAIGEYGEPEPWWPYHPAGARGGSGFRSGPDGRLTPDQAAPPPS
ncbi:hypothetical protein [Catenuloplanes atrovinosus]|uniref:Uncharacterized protein n=1 Tax=Catenuloplanes atrovinosus TaxID=137266 RepID=A0AAE3YL61_9ACTN|nr:hypothetical protein [Catenuloplanes atrovinosus]MDR7274233.1 hypothetical protein [Catenuloplanes atrovinosus]